MSWMLVLPAAIRVAHPARPCRRIWVTREVFISEVTLRLWQYALRYSRLMKVLYRRQRFTTSGPALLTDAVNYEEENRVMKEIPRCPARPGVTLVGRNRNPAWPGRRFPAGGRR